MKQLLALLMVAPIIYGADPTEIEIGDKAENLAVQTINDLHEIVVLSGHVIDSNIQHWTLAIHGIGPTRSAYVALDNAKEESKETLKRISYLRNKVGSNLKDIPSEDWAAVSKMVDYAVFFAENAKNPSGTLYGYEQKLVDMGIEYQSFITQVNAIYDDQIENPK